MPISVALLRGINVGGRTTIAMSEVRELFDSLGFAGARTVLQSGNVIFDSGRHSGATLERRLERETAKRMQRGFDYVVRSAADWKWIVERNPFPNEAKNAPGQLVVLFLKTTPPADDVSALEAAIQGPERIRHDGKQLYIVYPAGIGRSKLTGAAIEKRLGMRGTARNWNTVLKVAALCNAD